MMGGWPFTPTFSLFLPMTTSIILARVPGGTGTVTLTCGRGTRWRAREGAWEGRGGSVKEGLGPFGPFGQVGLGSIHWLATWQGTPRTPGAHACAQAQANVQAQTQAQTQAQMQDQTQAQTQAQTRRPRRTRTGSDAGPDAGPDAQAQARAHPPQATSVTRSSARSRSLSRRLALRGVRERACGRVFG